MAGADDATRPPQDQHVGRSNVSLGAILEGDVKRPRWRLAAWDWLQEERHDLAVLDAEVRLDPHRIDAWPHDGHVRDVAAPHRAPIVRIHPETISGPHKPAAHAISPSQIGSLVGSRRRYAQDGVVREEVDRLLAVVVVDQLQEEVNGLGGAHSGRIPDGADWPFPARESGHAAG